MITQAAETCDVGGTTVTWACLIHKGMIRKPDESSGVRIFAVDLEIWGKLGKAFSDYVAPEVPVVVAGRLQLPSVQHHWEHEGDSRWGRLLVCVDNWQFLFPQLLPEDEAGDHPATLVLEPGLKQRWHPSQATL